MDGKIQRVEENILQWIDEETKVLKDNLDKDIHAIRNEVDTKNVELNAKVQASIHDLREEVIEKVTVVEHKIIENQFDNGGTDYIINEPEDTEGARGTQKAIVDLKNKLHQNCNTLRSAKQLSGFYMFFICLIQHSKCIYLSLAIVLSLSLHTS